MTKTVQKMVPLQSEELTVIDVLDIMKSTVGSLVKIRANEIAMEMTKLSTKRPRKYLLNGAVRGFSETLKLSE